MVSGHLGDLSSVFLVAVLAVLAPRLATGLEFIAVLSTLMCNFVYVFLLTLGMCISQSVLLFVVAFLSIESFLLFGLDVLAKATDDLGLFIKLSLVVLTHLLNCGFSLGEPGLHIVSLLVLDRAFVVHAFNIALQVVVGAKLRLEPLIDDSLVFDFVVADLLADVDTTVVGCGDSLCVSACQFLS